MGQWHMSYIWRQVVVAQNDYCVRHFMSVEHFQWIIGIGGRTLFWHEILCLDEPLSFVFLRLFRLNHDRSVFVCEYLKVPRDEWPMLFTRDLQVFEGLMLNELYACTAKFHLRGDMEDILIWKFDTLGSFLVVESNIMFAFFRGRVVRHVIQWNPPMEGVLKFNVDGTARSKPGLAGCGGCFMTIVVVS
ncbi:hypothetical protein V6N13_089470 [Hibiscus sabdariffa]